MNKLLDFIKSTCIIILIPIGLIDFIYEFFIWNKGALSDFANSFFDMTYIIGAIAILVFGLTFVVEKINNKIKSKKK